MDGYDLIGLVDARFEAGQTVLHKEILFALSIGAHIWGAASMGALRAAECAAFGMRGFGRIFEMVQSGVIEDDAEVALQYGPAELGYPALSEPLANIRATLEAAVAASVIDDTAAALLLQAAGATPFKQLGWDRLVSGSADKAAAAQLAAWLPEGRVDQKALDALALAQAMGDAQSAGLARFEAEFVFEETTHWRRLRARFESESGRDDAGADGVMDEVRLDPLLYEELLVRAFARRAAGGAASFDVADGALDAALERDARKLEPDMLRELEATGAIEALQRRARAKREALGDAATAVPGAFAAVDLRDLVAWFQETRGVSPPDDDLDAAARMLGLADAAALHALLRREFEYSRATETTEPEA